jgi:hypothetical protein
LTGDSAQINDRQATVLRGQQAALFLEQLKTRDDQELMARATGNYKRGNERSWRH